MKDLATSILADSRLSRVARDLSAMLQPAIRLETFPWREEDMPLGSTRIGGKPDLPNTTAWPTWNGKPLVFLAQIDLGELMQFPCANVLPKEGWLVFFYDAEQLTWGFDPKDEGSWAVIFVANANAKLERRGVPTPILRRGFYDICRVEMHEIVTAIPCESSAIERLQFDKAEEDAYLELLDGVYADRVVCHQLLGHPQPVQRDDMQLECRLVSSGLYCGDLTGYRDPRAEELAEGAEDWRLLFQLDTDDNAGMMWGDVGKLYFWMLQKDLESRAFDRGWMILQCG